MQALTAGSYFPVCPTISGAAKLHITNGYFPDFNPMHTLKKRKKLLLYLQNVRHYITADVAACICHTFKPVLLHTVPRQQHCHSSFQVVNHM